MEKVINIDILRQPKDLTNEELSKVFDSVIEFDFSKWILEELKIERDNGYGRNLNVVTIHCKNTGYNLLIYQGYVIKASSSDGFDMPLSVISLFNCLLDIGAVKLIK
jgi:hypothetical protein